jgi:hypothetical protein
MIDPIFERINLVEKFIDPICIHWVYEGKYILEDKMYFGGCFLEAHQLESSDETNIHGMLQELLVLFNKDDVSLVVDRALWAVLHELSHFIEIDDARALSQKDWGLKHGTVLGKCNYSGNTFQSHFTDTAIQRELRVLAIQFQLSQHLEVPVEIEKSVFLLKDFLSTSFCYLPGNGETEKIAWAIAKVKELIQQPEYSLSQLIAEINRKKELLHNFRSNTLKQG